MNHYMIDIETLGTSSDCMILSIAVVKFSEDEIKDTLLLYPALQEQQIKGRKIEIDTLTWWMKSLSMLQANIDPEKPRKSLAFCYNQLAWFLAPDSEGRIIWAKSPSFHLGILRHMITGAPDLWDFREEADVRTAELKLKSKQIEIHRPLTPHDPMCDAITQAKHVQRFLEI